MANFQITKVWQDECYCKLLPIGATRGPECSDCEGLASVVSEGSGKGFHNMVNSFHSWAWFFDVNVMLGNLS